MCSFIDKDDDDARVRVLTSSHVDNRSKASGISLEAGWMVELMVEWVDVEG